MSQPISFPSTPAPMQGLAPAMSPTSINLTLPPAPSFQDLLNRSLNEVNSLDAQAQSSIARGLAGEDITQAEVFTSVRKADLALRTMLQIRNKVLDAYREVQQMRM